ncbi:NUDIX domain-containing protein [soil metagenome]
MPKLSAGLLIFRRTPSHELEVLLVHPGGPFWAKKDAAAWSIPKGEVDDGEDAEACAMREFEEELGHPAPSGDRLDLGEVRQASGKRVRCWAVEGDLGVESVVSNTFEMEWPPHSGRRENFPEVDRAAWFSLNDARPKLVTAQVEFLERLIEQTR